MTGGARNREPLFSSIWLTPRETPEEGFARYFVTLSPETAPVRLDQLTERIVAQHMIPYRRGNLGNEFSAVVIKLYRGGGYEARFQGSRLVFFGICSACNDGSFHPVIAVHENGPFYTLPLTTSQMIEIFGLPDQLHWEITF
jgi:hypothetical protein